MVVCFLWLILVVLIQINCCADFMAKEGFFSIETSLNVLKELFKEEIISFDKQYDEFTLKYKGFCLWIYAYKEDGGDISENEITKLNLNVKYESQIPSQVRTNFKERVLALGLKERFL